MTAGADAQVYADALGPDSIAALQYTGGTTGVAKGAVLTHGNFYWSAVASAANLGVRPDDRWLACLPLYHVGGLSIALRSAIYGTTAVIHERFDEARVARALREERISGSQTLQEFLSRRLLPAVNTCVWVDHRLQDFTQRLARTGPLMYLPDPRAGDFARIERETIERLVGQRLPLCEMDAYELLACDDELTLVGLSSTASSTTWSRLRPRALRIASSDSAWAAVRG